MFFMASWTKRSGDAPIPKATQQIAVRPLLEIASP